MADADGGSTDAVDDALLAAVGRGNDWLRALLCTLARRGVALRQASPERALRLLDALAPLPLYKGGQFLFDLMEWEDLMVDGPPPPLLPAALDGRSLSRLADLLRAVQSHLDAEAGGGDAAGAPPAAAHPDATESATLPPDPGGAPAAEGLPPLEPGFHLYQDVVLGVVHSAGPALRAAIEL